MTKDNILYSIIGVLLGVILGYSFANYFNRRSPTPAAQTRTAAATQGSTQSQDRSRPSNAVADQSQPMPVVQEAIQQAQNNPSDFDAQMKVAQMYYQIQRYDEAIEYLMRANQLRPDSYEAVILLGNANFDAGHYEIAERWYTNALVKKPDDINARTDLGLTFLFRQPADYDRAIKEFRRSLEKDPKHEQTLQNLTVALTKKGDVKEAQTTLDKLVAVNPANQDIPKLRSEIEAAKRK